MLFPPRRDDTAVFNSGIKHLPELIERENELQFGALIEEALKPPTVEAIHAPAMPEVPIDVQLWSKSNADTNTVKSIVMPPPKIRVAAEWHSTTAPRKQVIAAGMFAEESQTALNIGLECPDYCLESFVHWWCEQIGNRLDQRCSIHFAARSTTSDLHMHIL